VRNGRVDEEALAALERGTDPQLAAAGLFQAAKLESDRENFNAARNYLQRALFALPDTPALQVHYSYVLLRLGRTAEALSQAEQAARLSPGSADAQQMLGATSYAADRLPDAIAAWKRSLALRPNASIAAQLAKAEREAAAERSFDQQDSRHFTLRYEGSAVPEALRRDVLRTLDQHYEDLVRAFGVAPRESIGVVLYTDKTFFNVTQAPRWAGALYDGKLRLPVGGLDGMTAELSRSLRHELAHSFIHQITRGRCPTWLNEGLAMLIEDRTSARNGRQLARLFAVGVHVPYNMLESDFVNLRADQADIAYAQSLAAAEFIHRTYGMGDLVRVLQRIGEGSGNEAALRATLRLGYAQLERDVGEYLKRTYGD
jgi:tetratricopeptide (TPR) repeat protein